MSLTAEKSVREIACEQPSSVRVFEKIGIDYCCGGARTLQSACDAQNLAVEDVLARISKAAAEAGTIFSSEELRGWNNDSMAELIQHIVQHHHAYVRENSVRLQALIEKVLSRHGDTKKELSVVRQKV